MTQQNIPKMLFLYRGWNSGINQSLMNAWNNAKPPVQLYSYDIDSDIFRKVSSKIFAIPPAIMTAGLKIFKRGTGNFKTALTRSPWHIKKMWKIVDKIQKQTSADFSLSFSQFPPVFKPAQPHFIYTDLTILANLYYADGQKRVGVWEKCIPYERLVYQQAAAIFTMSTHVSRSLEEQYNIPREKIRQVNAGYNVDYREEIDESRYYQKNILFVGFDWKRKGGNDLIEAFKAVKNKHPDATLTIVGCNPEVKMSGVQILGKLSYQQIAHQFGKASIFCMPSRREAFGIVYLEAMHAGLPVIACDQGATPDFVINDQTGYRISVGNTEELADRLIHLLNNPELSQRLGQNAKKLVDEQYTWQRTQQLMWQTIEKFI